MTPAFESAAGPYVFAFARCAAFAATAPPLFGRAVPPIARAALAAALTPLAVARSTLWPCCDAADLIAAGLPQAVIGATFGLAASAVTAAASAAGAMIDAILAQPPLAVDGSFGGASGAMSRLYALAFAAAFFGSGGFGRLVERVAAFPIAMGRHADSWPAQHVVAALGRECIATAVDLAWPALGAAFLATLIAGTLARLVPRLNGLFVATPIAGALTLVAVSVGAHALFTRFAGIGDAAVGAAGVVLK